MIDMGVARPSAQGHAMISTATALTRACASRGCRAPDRPYGKSDHRRSAMTAGTKYDATTSASRCMGARRSLRFADHFARFALVSVSLPTRSARMMKPPGAVDGAAGHSGSSVFFNRNRLARDHRFIHGAGPFEHDAIHRNLFAGTDAEPVADLTTLSSGTSSSRPSSARRAPSSAPDPSKALSALLGLTAGAQFQDLPQQDQSQMTAAAASK